MSNKSGKEIEGYFPYVVPPLEGLWWQQGIEGIDYAHKERFEWISMIRLPEFVTKEVFDWAVIEASEKKKSDFSKAEFYAYREGLCVQCMHIGSYGRVLQNVSARHGIINYMINAAADSQINTTAQHSIAMPIIFTPFHAAAIPTSNARIPARGICGAVIIAGNVITASVT